MNVSDAALAAILSPYTRIIRRVNIYESDGTTLWRGDVSVIDGAVTVDESRAERRLFDLTVESPDGEFSSDPEAFWYDKIIKPYRGVVLDDGTEETWQLGEFMVDQIREQNYPSTVQIMGRDYTKKCTNSKFEFATTFAQGLSLEVVIKDIASNAGITKFIFPGEDKQLEREFMFEAGTERWTAIVELATNYGYELFFDAQGYLVMREPRDPVTDASVWRFETEASDVGSVVSWVKVSKDTRLYNHVVVVGEKDGVPVAWAEAKNEDPGSPSRIARIGDRLYRYTSAFISTDEQAQDVADKFLRVHALEEWTLDLAVLVFPWLEAGEVVEFNQDGVTRWRMSSFNVPFGLEAMGINARRVEVVI